MIGPMPRPGGLDQTLADVAEGFCPLCSVALITHDGQACCPCGGCTYRLEGDRLEMTSCDLHLPKRCEHWLAIWETIEHRTARP
jgi:hypothetical protein